MLFSSEISTVASAEDIVSSIEAMRMQEEATYKCQDYLYQQRPVDHSSTNMPLHTGFGVDVECRTKMARWNYDILDFCNLNRETASIAMNYLDRYLLTDSGRHALKSRKRYQLAAMTCLYTAIKINEPEAMDPHLVSKLSRGLYSEDQITDMEVEILKALEWRLNPPSTMSFVRHFLQLVPASMMIPEVREAALEVARFQSELVVCEYSFVSIRDSTLALACVANALEFFVPDKFMLGNFLENIARVASINRKTMVNVQVELYSNGSLKGFGNPLIVSSNDNVGKVVESHCDSVHVSPRSIVNRA